MSKFALRTKPTQFTNGKTEETLTDIFKRCEENNLINESQLDNDNNTIDTHLIDIIVTNNSLQETQQWKIRTKDKFENHKDIKIDILSSKSEDYKKIIDYMYKIQQCTHKKDLPNILIVCYHSKRVCDDIIKLCENFGGIHPMILPNMTTKTKLNFHISLDEPDANIGVTKKFISKIKQFIINNTIIGVLFITATPVDDFWKMLNHNGITKLLNMNKDNTHNFDEDFENYRSFQDHTIIEHNNDTNNPLGYIMDLFTNNKISENDRKIIFAPGHLYTDKQGKGSHSEISDFFLCKKYVVLLMNGKFKGFKYPNNTKITLEEYKNKYSIKGELRNILKHWSENNITTNMVITGYYVIERGVTFNTTNFNFTDMILSNYHMKSISKLIQLVGRGTGNKKFVDKMNIYCTTKLKNTIVLFNDKFKQICRINPESFNRTDFSNSNNTIPVKMIINDNLLLNKLIKLRIEHKRGYMVLFHNIIVKGIKEKTILLYDNNNINRFDINLRILKSVRMFQDGDKKEVRRFKNFNDNYEQFKSVSQSGDNTQYSIDFAKDKYIHDGFTNDTNIAWITFKI
jgi:hypothetical protein